VKATRVFAAHEGVSAIRCMREASQFGLVPKGRGRGGRGILGFQNLVQDKWGQSDQEKGTEAILRDLGFTVWRLAQGAGPPPRERSRSRSRSRSGGRDGDDGGGGGRTPHKRGGIHKVRTRGREDAVI
jgi:hypothetical protein